MFMHGFWRWVLSVLIAFGLGTTAGSGSPADSELQQKVQDHMDVITDEAAGIVDDVAEAAQDKWDKAMDSEKAKKVKDFVNDVDEVVNNTIDDIQEHFGPESGASPVEEIESAVEEVESAAEEAEKA